MNTNEQIAQDLEHELSEHDRSDGNYDYGKRISVILKHIERATNLQRKEGDAACPPINQTQFTGEAGSNAAQKVQTPRAAQSQRSERQGKEPYSWITNPPPSPRR